MNFDESEGLAECAPEIRFGKTDADEGFWAPSKAQQAAFRGSFAAYRNVSRTTQPDAPPKRGLVDITLVNETQCVLRF